MTDTILKRTTLIVRDSARQKKFYEDVFGWTCSYDAELELSGSILPCGKLGDKVQLYIMEGADKKIGKVGILEWLDPKLPDPGPPKHRLGIGDSIIVADVSDMESLVTKVAAFPGARVYAAPEDGEFPNPHGEGIIEYCSSHIFDPEGFFYELYYRYNQPNPDQFLIRRTTCIVRDVDASLNFLIKTLGLKKYQDSTMEISGQLAAGKPGDTVRFAVTKCAHDYIGMIGSLMFIKDPLEDTGDNTWDLGIGKAVFVAGTQDAPALYKRIKDSGVNVTRDLFYRAVSKTGGCGETKMYSMGFQDPDGFVWEVNQREDGR